MENINKYDWKKMEKKEVSIIPKNTTEEQK